MTKIKNTYDLIVGKTYKIIFPCYDDYNEGLEPNIDIVIITAKNKDGILALSMNSDNNYTLNYKLLADSEIYMV